MVNESIAEHSGYYSFDDMQAYLLVAFGVLNRPSTYLQILRKLPKKFDQSFKIYVPDTIAGEGAQYYREARFAYNVLLRDLVSYDDTAPSLGAHLSVIGYEIYEEILETHYDEPAIYPEIPTIAETLSRFC
jgi:hypothetical protein